MILNTQDSEEKPECKQDVKNLYHKLVKLEYGILTVVWEEVLECFNKTKLRENSADRIAHYESEAKGLCEDITSSYSDASKRIVTRKFSDGTSGIASLRGADKFRIEVLYQLYDCLIIQLRKRIDPYEQIAKRFKFLSELVNNSEIDEDSIKLIISYYKDDIDHKLVNECYLFKEYLHLRKSQKTEENTPSKMQCAEVLRLICEQHLIEVFSNITTALKLYLTMPITSCETERNFSKLSFIKNKFRSTMTEERLNSLCILSLENDSARKLSYDKTVREYVARKNRKKEYFVKCASCSMYSHRCLK
ncbi:zinc finger MYM-type protein 1-like isoform X2 [Scyliorhinus torazame]|uniref:zinc finger MYM-type protein 1-like isoform X2 n=1 Tax=Scyliorhinus torazame TaxID=75743 RepID=UPI003B5B2994